MPGLLVHLFVGIICAVIVFKFFKKKEYSLAIFIGNLLPDLVGAGYASLAVRSIDPRVVLKSAPWFSFERGLLTQLFWILLQTSFIAIHLFYQIHIKKKKYNEYEDILVLLLLGFIIHMVMDMFIIEHGVFY